MTFLPELSCLAKPHRSGRNVIKYRNNSTSQGKQFTKIGQMHTESIASESIIVPKQTYVEKMSLSIETIVRHKANNSQK